MELCTSQAISNLPSNTKLHGALTANTFNLLSSRTSLPLKRSPLSRGRHLRVLRCTSSFPRETISEETSTGVNEFVQEKRDGAITVENVPPVEADVTNVSVSEDAAKIESPMEGETQTLEFLDNMKLDSENTYSVLLYGGSALVALYLASAVVGAIDSIPLFPKLMEVVGLGYTFWFTTRYLLFKENREELEAKIEEIKQQVLGSDDN